MKATKMCASMRALQPVIDGAQSEVVLEVLEGGFDLGELDVALPQLSR